jgi:hypothetical protein
LNRGLSSNSHELSMPCVATHRDLGSSMCTVASFNYPSHPQQSVAYDHLDQPLSAPLPYVPAAAAPVANYESWEKSALAAEARGCGPYEGHGHGGDSVWHAPESTRTDIFNTRTVRRAQTRGLSRVSRDSKCEGNVGRCSLQFGTRRVHTYSHCMVYCKRKGTSLDLERNETGYRTDAKVGCVL